MQMYTNDGGVDHLHARIVSERQAIHDAVPDARSAPANEAIVAESCKEPKFVRQITPWRT